MLAGVLGALRMQGRPPEAISQLKVAVVGAGSAGIGVSQALHSAMVEAGIPGGYKAAAANFMVFDKDGLVGKGRKGQTEEVMVYARDHPDLPDGMDITAAIEQEKPQLILGLSGRRGTIPEAAIRAMAAAHERPIVFPLSNPTSSCEITPAEAYSWTDGRAIVATGSPFDPVSHGSTTLTPSQCNNMYIFPGVGLGASVCAAETVPDSMLYRAAVALSRMTSELELQEGRVFPAATNIREVSREVATAVAHHAYEKKIARTNPARGETVEDFVERKMYYPEYVPIFSKVHD